MVLFFVKKWNNYTDIMGERDDSKGILISSFLIAEI